MPSRRIDTWDDTAAGHTTWAVHSHTEYDRSDRPVHVTADKGSGDSSHSPVADLTYCYAAGNSNPLSCSTAPSADRSLLQSVRDNLTGAVTRYGYDAGNRLTSATTTGGPNPASYTYSYDVRGNRLTASGNPAVHYNPANQVTDAGSSYDGAGNLTASPTLGTAAYNAAGQLTAVTTPGGGQGTYRYADRNQNELVAQTIPGGSAISYTYGRTDRNGLPQLEQVGIGGSYGYLEHDPTTGAPLAIRVTNGNQAFYIADGLGRPIALVNSAGSTSSYAYDPYGVTSTTANGSAAGQNPYRFAPGSLYDRTTSMLKYGQRWYDPTSGRFTQQDTLSHLADPQQGNKYAYAGDPINNTDPTSESIIGDYATDAGTGAAIGLGVGAIICVTTGVGCIVAGAAGADAFSVTGGLIGGVVCLVSDIFWSPLVFAGRFLRYTGSNTVGPAVVGLVFGLLAGTMVALTLGFVFGQGWFIVAGIGAALTSTVEPAYRRYGRRRSRRPDARSLPADP